MSLPTITVCGNMKRIEFKELPGGKKLCKFQVECGEKNAKGEWSNLYISGECWEKSAEFVNQYFNDGSPTVVTGKLYTNVYEKQDGTKVYENKLLFPNVSFAPKDKSEPSNGETNNQASNYQQQGSNNNQNSYQSNNGQTNNQHGGYGNPNQQQQQMPQQPNQLPSMDDNSCPF